MNPADPVHPVEGALAPLAADAFLHLSDLHFWEVVRNPLRLLNKRLLGNANVWWRRRHEFRTELAGEVAEYIASLGVRTLIFGGDFSSTATDREFAAAADFVRGFASRAFAIHLMPGNHDVYTFEAVRARRFERHFAAWLPAEGYPCLRRLPGGTPLLMVPTVCPNVLSAAGRVTRATLERTRALLDEADGGPLVVAAHYPALHRTYAYHSARERRLRGAERLLELLRARTAPAIYVAGHVHRVSYVRDPEQPALLHLATAALFQRRRGQPIRGRFSEVRVLAAGFEAAAHELRETWSAVPLDARDGGARP